MLLIRSVLCMISRSRESDSSRRDNASNNAPIPPTPAASVGVASPLRIEPSTANIRISGGNSAFMTAPNETTSPSARRCAGTVSGRMNATPRM